MFSPILRRKEKPNEVVSVTPKVELEDNEESQAQKNSTGSTDVLPE